MALQDPRSRPRVQGIMPQIPPKGLATPPFQLPRISSANYAKLAASVYYDCLGNFDRHLVKYITRYQDHFHSLERYDDEADISDLAIQELARRMTPRPDMLTAKVGTLCHIYQLCNLPDSNAAIEKLLDWSKYTRAHSLIDTLPSEQQLCYEQEKAAEAESAATNLWNTYKKCCKNPITWMEDLQLSQKMEIFQQRERALAEAHCLWLRQHQPLRIAPAKDSKLRPEAPEFKSSIPTPMIRTSSPEDLSIGNDTIAEIPTTIDPSSTSPKVLSPSSPTDEHSLPLKKKISSVDSTYSSFSDESIDILIKGTEEEVVKRKFNQTIQCKSSSGKFKFAGAMLDTGCQGPNMISREFVFELGLGDDLIFYRQKHGIPDMIDANNHVFRVIGEIELDFCFYYPEDKYCKWRNARFNVVMTDHIQVIFGLPYIQKENLVVVNQDMITPLMADQKLKPETKQLQQINKAQQAREKADLELARQLAEQNQQLQNYPNRKSKKSRKRR